MKHRESTVVKIGTESLVPFENQKVNHLAEDIAELISEKRDRVVLVTSGAVGFGRAELGIDPLEVLDMDTKRLCASIGQAILMESYRSKFGPLGIKVAQVLPTHADIESGTQHAQALRSLLSKALSVPNVLPIINENDSLSTEEMLALKKGADNDKNALLISRLIQARTLAIVTNTNGVMLDLAIPNSRIATIPLSRLTDQFIRSICPSKSEQGTG